MCKDEEEKNMLETLLRSNKKQSTPKNFQISKAKIENLVKQKTPIVCDEGFAKIDSSHPDYKFWMED